MYIFKNTQISAIIHSISLRRRKLDRNGQTHIKDQHKQLARAYTQNGVNNVKAAAL